MIKKQEKSLLRKPMKRYRITYPIIEFLWGFSGKIVVNSNLLNI